MTNLLNAHSQYMTARLDNHTQMRIVSDAKKNDTDAIEKDVADLLKVKLEFDNATKNSNLCA